MSNASQTAVMMIITIMMMMVMITLSIRLVPLVHFQFLVFLIFPLNWINLSLLKFTVVNYAFCVVSVKLNLVDLEEEYDFSLPSAYARSILTVPWVELGDKITINCQKTGYSASVIFHTKVSIASLSNFLLLLWFYPVSLIILSWLKPI